MQSVVRRVVCYYYRKRLNGILHKIYYEFWPSRQFGKELHKELTRDSWFVCIGVFAYTFFGGLVCSLQYQIVPYGKRNLPQQTTFPFKWQESPIYEILYAWQAVLTFDIIFTVCGVDLFFVSLLSNCVAQFKLLKAYIMVTFKEVNEANRSAFKSRIKDPKEVINVFVRRHNNLIE